MKVRIIVGVALAVALIGSGSIAGAMDVGAVSAVWPTWTGSGGSGSNTVVVGDSLIDEQHDQVLWALASNGNRSYVTASSGSSYYPWNNRITGQNHWDLGDIPWVWGSRTTVLALGTNDARLLAQGSISLAEESDQIKWGVTRAVAGTTGCVILVQPSSHAFGGLPNYPAQAQNVRNLQAQWANAANASAGRVRVRLIDWNAQSAGHADWFESATNIHHSATGEAQYRNFILWYANGWRNAC